MFLDLCSLPPSRLSLLPHWFTAAGFLPHYLLLSFLSSPYSIYLSIFITFSHHSSVSRTFFLPPLRCSLLTPQWMPYLYTQALFFSSSDSCVSVCDAVCASGTTASSHLKHFRETHICCFRAQRDMPWQRLFEVASQGEPEPERGIWETIKKR